MTQKLWLGITTVLMEGEFLLKNGTLNIEDFSESSKIFLRFQSDLELKIASNQIYPAVHLYWRRNFRCLLFSGIFLH